MSLGLSLTIVSCTLVLQTGQVTTQSPTTPSHCILVFFLTANARVAKPKRAKKPKAKLLVFRNSRRLLFINVGPLGGIDCDSSWCRNNQLAGREQLELLIKIRRY